MKALKYFNRLLVILLIIPYAMCAMALVYTVIVFDCLLYTPWYFLFYGELPKSLGEYLMDNIPEKTDKFFQHLKKRNLL